MWSLDKLLDLSFLFDKRGMLGLAQWLTPVIPALWGAQVDHSRSEVREQSGQHGKIPSLLKIQKLVKHDGAQLLGRLRQENCLNPGGAVAVSQNHTTALQLGEQSKTPLQKIKNKNKNYVLLTKKTSWLNLKDTMLKAGYSGSRL